MITFEEHPHLKSGQLSIIVSETGRNLYLNFIIVKLPSGQYMIAEEDSDIDYQRVTVRSLDPFEIREKLETYVLRSNLAQGSLTSHQIGEIALALSNFKLD